MSDPYAFWRPIIGHPDYEVSSDGEVRSLGMTCDFGVRKKTIPGRVLKSWLCHGYPVVGLRGKKFYVHTLVARVFLNPDPQRTHVNHKNGDKQDNRISNLEYVTCAENNLHNSRALGKNRGELQPLAKLTDDAVREIRRSTEMNKVLAKRYGVDPMAISLARRRKTWTHVD